MGRQRRVSKPEQPAVVPQSEKPEEALTFKLAATPCPRVLGVGDRKDEMPAGRAPEGTRRYRVRRDRIMPQKTCYILARSKEEAEAEYLRHVGPGMDPDQKDGRQKADAAVTLVTVEMPD